MTSPKIVWYNKYVHKGKASKPKRRKKSRKDVLSFNLTNPLGVGINDLYTLTESAPNSCRSDMTYFYTEDGIRLIGEKVVKTICETLEIPLSQVKDIDASVPNISKELMGF